MHEQPDNSPLPQAGEGAGERAGNRGQWWLWLGLSALVIVLDQWSKHAIVSRFAFLEALPVTSFFDLVLAHNQGAAFSFLGEAGGWQRWMLSAISVAASAWIVWMLRAHLGQKLFCLALALILGGALGNLIDRLAYGYVVDFLDFHLVRPFVVDFLIFHWELQHFPAFNLADSGITGGAGLLVLDYFIKNRKARAARPASPGD